MKETIDFEKLSCGELMSIWEDANVYEWNGLLGEKPEGFDSLPVRKHWWQFWIKRTKSDYTAPVWIVVGSLLKISVKKENCLYKKLKEEYLPTPMEKFRFMLIYCSESINRKSKKLILEHFSKNSD